MFPAILKKIIYLFLMIAMLSHTIAYADNKRVISDYQETFAPCFTNEGELRIAIRIFSLDNILHYLVVNPETFATEIAPVSSYKLRRIIEGTPGYFNMKELMATPYMRALQRYTSAPYVLQNQGITHAEKPVDGAFITIDMCPSVKPFEKEFFELLITIAEKNQKPLPIAISMTGRWMIDHADEFNWLLKQVNENKLQITWMNHSFTHVYYADLPYDQNFMLEPHTNVTHEILATEKLLLEQGQVPSVFFRFPGLVSNKQLIRKLQKFGLIPVGTDAWLAYDEPAHSGSIILVHGNSNEPDGIKKIIPILQNNEYHWLPLNQLFVN